MSTTPAAARTNDVPEHGAFRPEQAAPDGSGIANGNYMDESEVHNDRGKRACADSLRSESTKVARRGSTEAAAAPPMPTAAPLAARECDKATSCSVCFLPYDAGEHSPLLLPCWHTFCSKCVRVLSRRQCPMCRKVFEIGEAKPNFLAQDLLALAGRQGEVKVGLNRAAGLLSSLVRGGTETSAPSGRECVVCQCLDKEVAATHVRKQPSCGVFLCEEHGEKHRGNLKQQDHELCELGSTQPCGVHRGELRRSFCLSCMEILCFKCSVERHAGHNVMTVGGLLERLQGELPEELTTLEAALEEVRQGMAETEGMAAEVEASIAEAERVADMVVGAVSQWRKDTQQELDRRRRAAQAGVAAARAEWEGMVAKLEVARDVVRDVLKGVGGTDVEGMEAAAQAVVGVGEAQVGHGARQGEQGREGLKSLVLVGTGRGAMEKSVRALLDSDVAKVRHVPVGRARRGGGGVMLRWCGVGTVLKQGRFGHGGFGTVELNLKMITPCGVAVLENGNLIVCNGGAHRLEIFTVDGRFVRSIGTRMPGSGSGKFEFPSGVAVLEDGNLVVCDENKNRLQILTVDGHFVRTLGCRGCCNLEFKFPRDVAVLENGNLVVGERSRLQILTVDGRFVRTIASGRFNEVGSVVVLEDGNLVVSDVKNHQLQILTVDGHLVRTIGCRGSGNLEFNEPEGVAVLEDGNVVVCDSYNDRLQIITVGGEFVRQVPCLFPVGVAVLDRDHVAVSLSDPHNCIEIVRVSG